MNQEPLFFEDWREAMRHVVAVLGGPKPVGSRMRPDMKPDDAADELRRRYIESARAMADMVKRIELLETRGSTLRPVA